MGHFVQEGDQKGPGVQVFVDADAVGLACRRQAVVTKLGASRTFDVQLNAVFDQQIGAVLFGPCGYESGQNTGQLPGVHGLEFFQDTLGYFQANAQRRSRGRRWSVQHVHHAITFLNGKVVDQAAVFVAGLGAHAGSCRFEV